jgi:RHS repeat-associated protein
MDYDVRGRLSCHAISSATGDLPVDDTGRRFTRQSFTYDCLDNLLAVDTTFLDGSEEAIRYEHDPIDRDRVTAVVTTLTDNGISRQHRTIMRYDEAGRLVDDGNGGSFDWDGAGRLAFASPKDGDRRAYRYGPDGRVACADSARGTAYRYYDDGRLYGEFSDDDERRFIRAGDVAIAETVLNHAVRSTWLLGTDPQGSVVMEARDEPRWRTYGAYGERDASGDGARGGFAGETSEDGTGCYLLGDRPYSPRLRRFLSPDHASPFEAGGLNRYAYCGGDPINRVDPTGESWLDWLGVAVGIAGAVIATVATGGVFAGVVGAAAAGSLAGTVVTPGMMAMATATVLDVTATAVDLASNVASEAGEDGAAGILGWVALATGLGSAAMGRVPALPGAGRVGGGASRRFVGRTLDSGAMRAPPNLIARKTYPGTLDPKSVKQKWEHASGRIVKLYRKEAVTNKIPARVQGNWVRPKWHERPNRAGGTIYAADTFVTSNDVATKVTRLAYSTTDNKDIHILSGVHGYPRGDNYTRNGRRTLGEPQFFQMDTYLARHLQVQTGRRITVTNIYRKSDRTIGSLSQKNAHIVQAYCFGAADPVVMEAMNVDKVKAFRL